ncbi:hypothetical protein L345_05660, partial [Ophiophagus hannah]
KAATSACHLLLDH